MSEAKCVQLAQLLSRNTYPGRGIVLGKSPSGKHAVVAYFIMGRSVNSRNRVFVETQDGIRTEAFDPAKMSDPSLIIYHPVRFFGEHIIVTNGDQTDTVRDFLQRGETFEAALDTRCFEPDAPNFTPRVSGLASFSEGGFAYKLSILKSADAQGSACERFTFAYPGLAGVGHFIHTYSQDGDPIPAFAGEPESVVVGEDIDAFTDELWANLNGENKVSLYVCYREIFTGETQTRLVNKNAR